MRAVLISIGIWGALCLVLALLVGWGKPAPVIGMFVVSGMAVGSLYALGGIGLVVLYRATGVLNLASGAIGTASAMVAWQLVQWGIFAPVAWILGLALGVLLAVAYGRVITPYMAWREPVVKAVASYVGKEVDTTALEEKANALQKGVSQFLKEEQIAKSSGYMYS